MKISSGTIGFRVPFQLHRHAFLTPWVDKNSLITCSKKSRDYSSDSGPVRYIPKKSYQNKKSESSIRKESFEFSEPRPPLESKVQFGGKFFQRRFDFDSETRTCDNGIEQSEDLSEGDNVVEELEELKVHQQCSNQAQAFESKMKISSEKLRENLDSTCHDGQRSFGFHAKSEYQDTIMQECEEVSEEDDILEEREDELNEELVEEPSIPRRNRYDKQYESKPGRNKTKYDAEKAAVKLLATRAFTTVELKKKLCGKGHSTSVVDAVITDFQSRGLLNDSWFAEAFCQSRWSSSTWGPRRIKQELSRKGVSKVDTENAIDVVFRDEESESSHGLSKTSMDTLFTQASKQWLRGRESPKETRKSRMIRWLLYRGFSWDVIGSIMKRLESGHPP